MAKHQFTPAGVCAKNIEFEITDGKISSFEIVGGCPGNLIGIKKIILGMTPQEVIEDFKDVKCGVRNTSCPDQISIALTEYLEKISA